MILIRECHVSPTITIKLFKTSNNTFKLKEIHYGFRQTPIFQKTFYDEKEALMAYAERIKKH